MRMLRRISGMMRVDRTGNKYVRCSNGIESIVNKISEN